MTRENCGEGFPTFYVDDYEHKCPHTTLGIIFELVKECIPMSSYNFTVDEKGLPLISDCKKHEFMKYYTSPEVASAFASFYNNSNGLMDKFLHFWEIVA